jgi:hypothetical protein
MAPKLKASARTAVLALAVAAPLAMLNTSHAAEAMRVVRDPVTGELRGPTAVEAAAFEKAEAQLRASQGRKPQPPVEIRHPDGSIEMKLGEDTHMYSVVRERDDGSLAMACLPAKQAQDFVKAGARKSTAPKAFAARPVAKKGPSHD